MLPTEPGAVTGPSPPKLVWQPGRGVISKVRPELSALVNALDQTWTGKEPQMQSFGDETPIPHTVAETPTVINAPDDPSTWTPEEESPPSLEVPDGLPEADVLEQQLPA